MIATAAVMLVMAVLTLAAAWTQARQARRDEGRMAGYVASLKAVAERHRLRALELEQAVSQRDQLLAAQDRLLEGQACHLRGLDPAYAG